MAGRYNGKAIIILRYCGFPVNVIRERLRVLFPCYPVSTVQLVTDVSHIFFSGRLGRNSVGYRNRTAEPGNRTSEAKPHGSDSLQ